MLASSQLSSCLNGLVLESDCKKLFPPFAKRNKILLLFFTASCAVTVSEESTQSLQLCSGAVHQNEPF